MNKITINKDSFKLGEHQIEHGTLSIGRAADNDISLDDSAMSSHHAKIVTVFTASHIEDLGSTNGTYVNGEAIVEHTLHSGDVITLGNYQIIFYSDYVNRNAPEKNMLMSGEKLQEIMNDAQKQKKREAAKLNIPSLNVQAPTKTKKKASKQDDNIVTDFLENPLPWKRPGTVSAPVVASDKANAEVDELFRRIQEPQGRSNNRYLYFIAAVIVVLVVAGASVMVLT